MRLMMHFDRMTGMSNISDIIQVNPKTIVSLLTCWLSLFINIQPTQHSQQETFSSYRKLLGWKCCSCRSILHKNSIYTIFNATQVN